MKQAEAATSSAAKERWKKESEDAWDWARAWGEGARLRKGQHQTEAGISAGTAIAGLIILVVTFVRQKTARPDTSELRPGRQLGIS